MINNFFAWQAQVRLLLKGQHSSVDTETDGFRRDMEAAYFKRHLSCEEFVDELTVRLKKVTL